MKKIISLFIFLTVTLSIYAKKPVVLDIQAKAAKGTKINIYWTLPENPDEKITKLLIYRSTKPITNYKELSTLLPIAELNPDATEYVDSVKDYKDYFYAIITITDKPYEIILVSMNSTVNGVHLKQQKQINIKTEKNEEEKLYTNGTIRETPLPYLDLIEGQNEDKLISDEISKSTKFFSNKNKDEKINLSPYFFEEDLVSPDSGDEYILFDILKNTFVQEKYIEAETLLQKLSKRNINENVLNRTYFYLGEVYYFQEKYEEAVKYFIQVSHIYPLITRKWLNACMDNIEIK